MAKIYRKIMFFAVLAFLIAGFAFSAGCTGTQNDGAATATEIPTTEQTAEMTNIPSEETQSPAESMTFSGKGDQKTTMNLSKGANLFTLVQDKPEGSTVYITTKKDGISVANAYNATVAEKSMKDGKYYWSQAFMLEEDAVAEVEVTTLSEWTLDFSFPQMINGIVPQTFTGAANKATPFFQINKGEYNFSIKAENNEVISVTLMDYYGNPVLKDDIELPLAYHRGNYDDVVTVSINESNNYLMNIVCDGDWTVSVA